MRSLPGLCRIRSQMCELKFVFNLSFFLNQLFTQGPLRLGCDNFYIKPQLLKNIYGARFEPVCFLTILKQAWSPLQSLTASAPCHTFRKQHPKFEFVKSAHGGKTKSTNKADLPHLCNYNTHTTRCMPQRRVKVAAESQIISRPEWVPEFHEHERFTSIYFNTMFR